MHLKLWTLLLLSPTLVRGCIDDPSFLHPKYDDRCSDWVEYNCYGEEQSTYQIDLLLAACPVTCGQCDRWEDGTITCADDPDFADPEYSDGCDIWVTYGCVGWGDITEQLLAGCPVSCGVCTPSSTNAVSACWEARPAATGFYGYESLGYTCVGDYCASTNPGGNPNTCATVQPDGYVVDENTGRCVAPVIVPCWEAYTPDFDECSNYAAIGFTCYGDYCAIAASNSSAFTGCAVVGDAGSAVDDGRCRVPQVPVDPFDPYDAGDPFAGTGDPYDYAALYEYLIEIDLAATLTCQEAATALHGPNACRNCSPDDEFYECNQLAGAITKPPEFTVQGTCQRPDCKESVDRLNDEAVLYRIVEGLATCSPSQTSLYGVSDIIGVWSIYTSATASVMAACIATTWDNVLSPPVTTAPPTASPPPTPPPTNAPTAAPTASAKPTAVPPPVTSPCDCDERECIHLGEGDWRCFTVGVCGKDSSAAYDAGVTVIGNGVRECPPGEDVDVGVVVEETTTTTGSYFTLAGGGSPSHHASLMCEAAVIVAALYII